MAKYCLDADVLIQAKNGAYAFDLAPMFWSWLAGEFENGSIVSTRSVYKEIVYGKDELSQWVQNRKQYFISPSKDTQQKYSQIAEHVALNYETAHVNTFLSGADPWVIAHSLSSNLLVVTHEQLGGQGTRKVKIPNICRQFNVKWINLYMMMRKLGGKLQ